MRVSRKKRRSLAIALVLGLMGASVYPSGEMVSQAKDITVTSKIALSQKRMYIKVGKVRKLVMENADKKVKWSISSSDGKYIRIRRSDEVSVKVKGIKKGMAYVTGEVKGKKYTCRLTVRGTDGSMPTAAPATATPKATATTKPTSTAKSSSTPKPTASAKASATPKPTKKPVSTATPKPTKTPAATATPKPTKTPAVTVPPGITVTSEPTVTVPPLPSSAATATPKPTATPAYTKAPEIIVAETDVAIGHASINERYSINNGIPGDQTGREVYIRAWYKNGWNKMIRCNDEAAADMMAKAMEQACANDNIGYAQDKRNTSFIEAQKVNWVLKNIKTPCEADCSSLIRLCVNCGYYAYNRTIPFPNVNDTFYTGNMANELKKTGLFTVYTASRYISNPNNLQRGDILVAEGSHTVMVLNDSPG